MPYDITWHKDGVVWTFHGTLTNQDARQANLDVYGDWRFEMIRYQIVDTTGVSDFEVESSEMDAAGAMDTVASQYNPRVSVAVIACEEKAVAVAEMYKSAMHGCAWDVEVFCSMNDAKQWINAMKGG